MFSLFRRGKDPRVTAQLIQTRSGGPPDIHVLLNQVSSELIEIVARKRGCSIEEAIIESLRVEQLLADGLLLVRQNGRFRELLSV